MMPTLIRASVLVASAISLSSVSCAQGPWSKVELPGSHPEVFALAVHGANQELFIGTGGLPNGRADAVGILWSKDHGTHVQPRADGFRDSRFDLLIRSLHSCEGLLVAASADGPYFSEDEGATWQKRAEGLPVVRQTSMRSANALTSLDGVIFCGTPQGIYRTSDAGRHWVASSSGLSKLDVRALTRLGSALFASTDGGGVCRSTDGGRSWQHASEGIPSGLRSRAIIAADGVVLAGTTQGTFRSVDQGATWSPALARANARSFAATDGLMAIGAFRGAGSIYVSQDRGEQWFDVSANLPRGGIGVWAMAFDDQYLYAAINRQGLWRIPHAELKSLAKPANAAKPSTVGMGAQKPSASPDSLLALLDDNHDGALSAAEIDNAGAALRTLDKNGDGRLSSDELGKTSPRKQKGATASRGRGGANNRSRQGNGGVRANLLALDADGDGELTRAEVPGRMQRIFDRADTDKNGVLNKAEIDRFAQQVGPGRGR